MNIKFYISHNGRGLISSTGFGHPDKDSCKQPGKEDEGFQEATQCLMLTGMFHRHMWPHTSL